MKNAAVAVEGNGNHALTAEYGSGAGAGAETFAEVFHMTHAVEERQDRRVWSDGRRERIRGGLKIIRLATEQNEVERPAQRICSDGRRCRQARIAKAAADDEAVFFQ